jgi:predicted permease
MGSLLAQMGLPILCGVAWGIIKPGGLDAELTRRVLTTVVFNLLLPALVLSVLWRSVVGLEALKISLFGIIIIALGMAIIWLASKLWRIERRRLGAVMLGAAFPNVTYLGLPVLEQTFGPWVRALVIQIDLFAAMPMVVVMGAAIGRYYGEESGHHRNTLLRSLLANPPLLAAVFAVLLNLSGLPQPDWLGAMLERLSAAVIPLMLIALGMGLNWSSLQWQNLPLSALVLLCRLALVPYFGVLLGQILGFSGDKLAALVMEAGMPSMMLGLVFCDRYRLDTAFYSMVVILSTVAGIFSVESWRQLLV